jgi:probable phosphoglycerate mutase
MMSSSNVCLDLSHELPEADPARPIRTWHRRPRRRPGSAGRPAVGATAGRRRESAGASAMSRHPQRPYTLPDGATEVVLVRHGASAAGDPDVVHGSVEGHDDPPLSPAGREQAIALGRRLLPEPLDALFVTPLQRTAETAAPLAASSGLQPIVVRDLREIFLGELERDFAALAAVGDPLIRRIAREQRWDVAAGAETMDAFAARVAKGLAHVAGHVGPDGRAVAVVHAAVVAEACRMATGSEPLAFRAVENASITRVVRLRNGRWMLRSFNDTAHLAGVQPTSARVAPAAHPDQRRELGA